MLFFSRRTTRGFDDTQEEREDRIVQKERWFLRLWRRYYRYSSNFLLRFLLVLIVGEKTPTTSHVNTLYTKVKFYSLERKSHETEVEEAKNLFN